jgi:methionyl-tRNA formyltransferase
MRWLINRLVRRVSRIWKTRQAAHETLETKVQAQGGRYVRVPMINGAECRRALQALQVDLMVLAGAPIVRAPILEVPRIGTINAHQGALPRFRGMNVIEWTVFEGHAPAISVHFVDPGVDTGDVIVTEPIPLQSGDTLEAVRRRASAQQVDLLARTVSAALHSPLPRRSQRPQDGRQYFVMHPRLRAVAEQLLYRRLQILLEV